MLTSLLIAAGLAVAAVCGIISVKFWGANNPVEQVAESVIAGETGKAPDLTGEAAAMGITGPAPKSPASK